MNMAPTGRVKLIIFLLTSIRAVEIMDDLNTHEGKKSRTVTIKYEGTQDEVEEFGKGLGLEFHKKAFGDWYIFRIPQPEINSLLPIDVPDIQINLNKAKKRDKMVKFIEQERYRKRVKTELTIHDKEWPNEWYMQPTHTPNMNVYKAWDMGYTGKGIVVAIVDDGVDSEHPDLINNYNSSLAFDFNKEVDNADHKEEGEGHGTNCADLVGAVKNTNCVIGVAYECTLTGIRLLSNFNGDVIIPSVEAMAFVHNKEYIDIYSNSWTVENDGRTMKTINPILNDAFELSITEIQNEGRQGKGTIYTFASGNGGINDNCNADPYSGSMFTISVAAVKENGAPTAYSERCTSILVATFSGDDVLRNITTTGPNATCVDDFDGTSAATPQVSGIIALTLQANPELTWRDIQHMIVELSNNSALTQPGNYDSYTNGARKQVSLYTGFGLIDAKAMVENAPSWPSSPPRISCTSGDINTDSANDNSLATTSHAPFENSDSPRGYDVQFLVKHDLNPLDAFKLHLGRQGKGTIYTFASGNGGINDNCNADPCSGSMFTISVAAVKENGAPTAYSERCKSILVATFSGDDVLRNITTTGPNATCVDDFDGTSAATPQVSGIIALTLQANPELTWRDIQHMIVELSNNSALTQPGNYDSYTNGAGKQVSLYTGFGLIDTKAMVENAPSWPSSPPRISCTSGDINTDRNESNAKETTERYNISNCFIKYLEHVQVFIEYKSSYRGDIEFYLLSPMGTESALLTSREFDNFTELNDITILSVHNWGEDPNGEWSLITYPVYPDIKLHLVQWGIDLYGTATNPTDGRPQNGVFGSPCNTSGDCADNYGCLVESCNHCDKICVPCGNGYHFNGEICEQEPKDISMENTATMNVVLVVIAVVATFFVNHQLK